MDDVDPYGETGVGEREKDFKFRGQVGGWVRRSGSKTMISFKLQRKRRFMIFEFMVCINLFTREKETRTSRTFFKLYFSEIHLSYRYLFIFNSSKNEYVEEFLMIVK